MDVYLYLFLRSINRYMELGLFTTIDLWTPLLDILSYYSYDESFYRILVVCSIDMEESR
jgi:hypothetical protein